MENRGDAANLREFVITYEIVFQICFKSGISPNGLTVLKNFGF